MTTHEKGNSPKPASPEQVSVLVVGGGIGGLAVALALARSGREVHLLEAADELGEIGAGIQLGPNATRMLDRVGLLEQISERAVFPDQLVYMDALSGERITAVDLGERFRAHYGFPYVVLHRSDLHNVLLEACRAEPGITIEVSKEVVRAEIVTSGALARCADGSAYGSEMLIGADGLRSVVRNVVSDDEPVPTPHVAYRGAIPFSEASTHAGVDNVVMWVAPDLHLVQYKLRGGELYNQVGVFRSYHYGETEDWGSPEELDEHFGRCCEPVRRGASLLGRSMRWPMLDREPIENWTRGRITLLGDAAHPMLQYIAQGGCQAIEDAVCLGEMVSRHPDPESAFLAYQDTRIPRTSRVQRTARMFGETCHIDGVGLQLRNALFSRREFDDYEPFDWLYKTEVGQVPTPAVAS